MTDWPQKDGAREPAEAEPVEPPQPDPAEDSGLPVALDVSAPAPGSGPPLSAAAQLVHSPLRVRSIGIACASLVSAAVHAVALAFLGASVAQPGLEAGSDAVSIVVITEAPPSPPASSSASPAEEARAVAPPDEVVEPEPATPRPVEEASPAPEPTEAGPQETEPVLAETASDRNEPLADEDVAADSAASTTDEEAQRLATVVLPLENVPTPTPRPAPPRAEKKADTPARTRAARTAEAAPPRSQAGPARRGAGEETVAHQSSAPSAGSRGGATAGEEEAFRNRLFRHVARHKRYPREAARQGVTGDTSLAITIDRHGRLAGARISRSSGHSILDEEAMAVARRASPYPRLPAGIGSARYTFIVTLRFSR